ncbi:hypothetical protein N7474_002679 [Penicillium riverlandense]|uniref:uncharacterized protein n=1 Tax=Penicillium riverlandense TaxID=1903569 RepID=UPI002548FD03|nr:uncharacterized protein N7474_002679 [Penicillium riverlandense]KAJ5825541.1 hypothetical protein N7474_002679 [Penicillium riverlandense]
MSCHTCSRTPHARLSFYCPTCARNQLYQLRIDSTHVLLEREVLGQQIETVVSDGNHQRRSVESIPDSSRRWTIQAITTRQAESSSRREGLSRQINDLKSEIKDKQAHISGCKTRLSRRHSDAESAKYQLSEREAGILTGVQNTTKRTEHLWHSLHSKTAEARIFLCREAANLYGLRQKVSRKGQVPETYAIGGIVIKDLRDMNGKFSRYTGATPAQISTSLSSIAHLLVLVSHYLSLRLPAEVTLPHRNYPTATIYAPAGSYRTRETPDKAPRSSSSSPTASKTTEPRTHLPRPRPLTIEKPLTKLVKEDPGTYALFIEGATLLAWNVAWLCRTQGINLASESWEDVCDIGKNMWQLLVAPPTPASTLMRAFAGREPQAQGTGVKDSPKTTIQRTKSFPMLGHYSHGTAHSFLGASEGTDFMRTWKLPTPTKIVDKLKATLLGEMASAEWELLEEQEWHEEATGQPSSGKWTKLK